MSVKTKTKTKKHIQFSQQRRKNICSKRRHKNKTCSSFRVVNSNPITQSINPLEVKILQGDFDFEIDVVKFIKDIYPVVKKDISCLDCNLKDDGNIYTFFNWLLISINTIFNFDNLNYTYKKIDNNYRLILYNQKKELCKGHAIEICKLDKTEIETRKIILSILHHLYYNTNCSFYFSGNSENISLEHTYDMYYEICKEEYVYAKDEEDNEAIESIESVFKDYNAKNGNAILLAKEIIGTVDYSIEELLNIAEEKQDSLIANLIVKVNNLIDNKFNLSDYFDDFNEETGGPIYQYMQIAYKIDDECRLWFYSKQDFQSACNEHGQEIPTVKIIYTGNNYNQLSDFSLLKTYTEVLHLLSILI